MIEHASTPADGTPDIKPIRRLIRTTVRLLRSSWVATGLGLSVGLALGTLVLAALLDLGLPLWTWFRLVALVLVVVPAVWAFVSGVVRPLFRRLKPAQVARRIEAHIPGIHNRLVSCIDLDAAGKKAQTSPEFYRRLVHEALERIRGFRPRTVVDGRSLRRAVAFAATSIVAFALAFGLFSDRLPTALARIFSPFADIPPASGVVYTVAPGTVKQLRGDDITFTVTVAKGDPERLTLELTPDGQAKRLRYDLQKQGPSTWTFTLSGFEASFDYRVRGGGTWTRLDRITMIDRPTVTDLHAVLHYPPYMGVPEPRVGPPQTGDVTGPEGSTVEVVVAAEGSVSEGEVQLLKSRATRVAVADRTERPWFQERLPEGAKPEGRWDWDFRLLARPAHTEPPAAGAHEHSFHSATTPFPVRAGENLFAMVAIAPGQTPESIMLAWHDGAGWEHRAYWGADKFTQGKPGTPARFHAGPLPAAEGWVRLEVPARSVDLEGKSVRGMSFALFGGQCTWHRAGALPASHVEKDELYVAERFPMESAGQGRWAGRFPLERDSLYRVELRNELGFANKAMKHSKATAIPDNPPQVVLERPGTDLTLSEAAKVPLSIAAYDDFGLADVVVSVQKGDSGGFVGRPVKHYDRPQRSESLTASLDLKALEVKPGEHVRYRVEARDRKGLSAQTQEFVVRIVANDANAADKQLEGYEKGQDTFRENLVKLIAEQAKVQESVKALAAKYAPLEEKVEAAQAAAEAEARPAPEGAPKTPDAKAAEAKPAPLKLDPEAAKQLAELRQELAQVAAKEQQNAETGKQVEAGLKQAAEQAAKLQLLPAEMLAQVNRLPQAFHDRALEPLQDLAAEMKRGGDAAQAPPDLAQMGHEAAKVQQELEAVKAQLEAAAEARKELPADVDNAIAKLRGEMLRQNADLTARDLAELQEFLKERAEELKRLEGKQEQLAEATPVVPAVLLPDLEKKQEDLDGDAQKRLDEARRLLDAERLRGLRRDDPEFPKAPYVPEAEEVPVPPKEEDPAEAADAKEKAKAHERDAEKAEGAEAKAHDEAGAEEDPLLMPALGGPRPKLDPRFADKLRPVPAKDAAKGGPHDDDPAHRRREELGARQQHRLAELDTARQSLASDEHSLEAMVRALREALHGPDPEAARQQLNRLMQDPAMREALAMAERRRQVLAGEANPHAPSPPHAGQANTDRADMFPTTDAVGSPQDVELAKLDLATRTVILKMQPKMREELLQGLREDGPDGYRGFIRDYFQRLTKVKGAP